MKRGEIDLLGIDEIIICRGSQIIDEVNEEWIGGSVVGK